MTRAAAVDIGTNTVRLLVADVDGTKLVDIVRDRAITRLGQGVDAERRLDREAMRRTLDAVARFVGRAKALGAERVRVAGTSALRDAGDRDRFATLLDQATGVLLEFLSGAEEARLSMLGATIGLPAGRYVVCDIGGGSMELSSSSASVSLDVGCVRLRERFLHDDPPSTEQTGAARAFVMETLGGAARALLDADGALVGVAGTTTTLAALVLGLDAYDRDLVHHATIERSDVERWSERLLAMTVDEIVAAGPVERGRADVLAAGVLILRCVMERFDHSRVLVSESDILDGLVLDLFR